VFSFGFWEKIPEHIIKDVRLGIVNVHQSYWLKYKGRNMQTYAMLNNDKFAGVTIHYIDGELDKGRIIDTAPVRILAEDTAFTLTKKCNELAIKLLDRNLVKITDDSVVPLEPPKHIKYEFHKNDEISHEIPLSKLKNVKLFMRHVRALTYPNKPKPYISYCGKKCYLKLISK
jgi:methionyl-tRNA formyltransferase